MKNKPNFKKGDVVYYVSVEPSQGRAKGRNYVTWYHSVRVGQVEKELTPTPEDKDLDACYQLIELPIEANFIDYIDVEKEDIFASMEEAIEAVKRYNKSTAQAVSNYFKNISAG